MASEHSAFNSTTASERSLGYLLMRVFRALRASMEEAVRPNGFTMPQVAVLLALGHRSGLSTADLARRAFVTPQAMGELLAGLETRGLVVRRVHDSHGRILPAELTAAGLAARQLCHDHLERAEAEMLSGLSTDERKALSGLLERCLHWRQRTDEDAGTQPAAARPPSRTLKVRTKR
jgi:DNA-binding MarR family transcriptional regulator